MYATIKDLCEFYLNADLLFVLFCRNKGDQRPLDRHSYLKEIVIYVCV